MSVLIPYDNFQSVPSVFASDNGPWLAYESSPDDIRCFTENDSWCHCMACGILSNVTVGGSYTVSLYTNVVINPSLYGGASALDFTWQFTPWFGSSSNQAQGTFQVVTSTLGNNTYVDSLRAGAWSETVWSSAPFVHAGTVPLPTGSNNNYISLAINITYARPYADTIGFYVKEAGFVITTPTVTPGSTTSAPSSSPTESIPSGGSGTSSKTGAIVGGVVGGVVLIAICVVIGFMVGRRKQKKNANAFPDGVLASPTSNMAQSPGWQNPMYPEQPNNMYRPQRPQQGY